MSEPLPPLPDFPTGAYRHYKGMDYTVLGVARHSETLEPLVVYRAEYGERGLWVRPLAMFMETVKIAGVEQPRFRKVDTPSSPVTPATPVAPTPPSVAATGPSINGITSDDRTMAMLAHLLGIFTGFLGPLIIWLVKKDQSAFVNDHGKEVINFHITLLLTVFVIFPALLLVAFIPVFGCLTFLLFYPGVFAICIGSLIFHIMGAIKANEGAPYRYPLNLRLIK